MSVVNSEWHCVKPWIRTCRKQTPVANMIEEISVALTPAIYPPNYSFYKYIALICNWVELYITDDLDKITT